MPDIPFLLLLVMLLAVGFDFVNGWTDACNSIATVVSTRVLNPRAAVVMAAVLNFVGALSGTAVASTIGSGIVKSSAIDLTTVAAALIAAILWSTVAWYFGLPTSESHGLISGLSGAAVATAGFDVLVWRGWQKVLTGLAFAPLMGFIFGFLTMLLLYWILRRRTPSFVQNIFSKLQILSAAFMAFSHGSNDAQKTMGIMALALLLSGKINHFYVPLWVIILSATVMGIGTSVGGWRVMKTIGMKVVKLQPVHGFAAETSAAIIIESASRLGIPLSTTHVISSGIIGVGGSKRLSAVRWGVAGDIVTAWILTFPICGILGWVMCHILNLIT